MRTTGTRNVFAVVLAGVMMATASPALAQAQSSQSDDPAPLTSEEFKAAVAAGHPLRIKNYNSDKYLEPSGGSTANGAKIVQRTSSGATVQRWVPVNDDGYVSYENVGSGRNLGIDGASTSVGAAAIQANPSGDLNQDWEVFYTGTGGATMKNRKSGLCLGISRGSEASNAPAGQYRCDQTSNQKWVISRWEG
ncbi:RICIN domain-containing protein [Streptomyces sp. NPDC051907]|uniref:RICIN domain-containing protein n=1 Tax=Streptomyces sp. NPDC051907 TaxID=3155284 RepID=UPI0034321C7A